MWQTILTAVAVFISTSIDYLLILTIVFAQAKNRKGVQHVVEGQYLGTALLIIVSLLAAFVLNFIPEKWIIGLLGLVPIILGIRAAVSKEADEDEESEEDEIVEKLEQHRSSFLFWTITLITIASGGDNLGIYIPYFAASNMGEILTALIVFIILTAVLCYVGYQLARIHFISKTLEKYERIIVPVVYIALGIYIMLESGTIQKLLQLLGVVI